MTNRTVLETVTGICSSIFSALKARWISVIGVSLVILAMPFTFQGTDFMEAQFVEGLKVDLVQWARGKAYVPPSSYLGAAVMLPTGAVIKTHGQDIGVSSGMDRDILRIQEDGSLTADVVGVRRVPGGKAWVLVGIFVSMFGVLCVMLELCLTGFGTWRRKSMSVAVPVTAAIPSQSKSRTLADVERELQAGSKTGKAPGGKSPASSKPSESKPQGSEPTSQPSALDKELRMGGDL